MIKKIQLPNLRWIATESEHLGRDWFEKTLALDALIENLGLQLWEESVFFLFSNAPEAVLEGRAQCLIARPVVGPWKELTPPFIMKDWTSSQMTCVSWERDVFSEQSLIEVVRSLSAFGLSHKQLASPFMLSLKRELRPELRITLEAYFPE